MIDYLIVIYKNYDLLELQVENFKRLFLAHDYNLIVVPFKYKVQSDIKFIKII